MPTNNVTGYQMHNASLNITTYEGQPETINVSGFNAMELTAQYGDHLTVNLKANSEWVGGFGLDPHSTAVVNGPGVFYNTLTTVIGSSATIGVNVIGTGTFTENEAHGLGKLEFQHSVSAGQTVIDTGSQYGGEFGVVQVDDPAAYHASNVLGFGEIVLEGLKATSYSFKNDLLSIFNGKTVVDTLKLAVQTVNASAPVAFGVSQVGSSVVVHADGSSYKDGGHLLAAHA